MNYRRIQRVLFRMQFDAGFAERLRAGEESAVEGLDEAELKLLQNADPVGIAADKDGRRKTQCLGNILKEYVLSATLAAHENRPLGRGFFASEEFHRAVMEDDRLPLAFGRFATRELEEVPSSAAARLLVLEFAMARARREPRRDGSESAGPEDVFLSPDAVLASVPEGTAAWAAALREAMDKKTSLPVAPAATGAEETLLFMRSKPASIYRFPEVSVEVLQPGVARVLDAARDGLTPAASASLAAELGAEPEDLAGFIATLLEEGVLEKGRA